LRLLSRIGLWAPVAVFIVGVHWMSGRLVAPFPVEGWTDKLLHAAGYCLFGACCVRAFHGGIRPLRALPTFLALLLAVGYGALDELNQTRIAGRQASLLDWVADAIGAGLSVPLVAALVVWRWKRVRHV